MSGFRAKIIVCSSCLGLFVDSFDTRDWEGRSFIYRREHLLIPFSWSERMRCAAAWCRKFYDAMQLSQKCYMGSDISVHKRQNTPKEKMKHRNGLFNN